VAYLGFCCCGGIWFYTVARGLQNIPKNVVI